MARSRSGFDREPFDMTNRAPVVALRGVTVKRMGTVILDDLDWEIHPCEHWVLFGANGSGKTTLLEVVSSYLFPTRGTVDLLGERLRTVDVRGLRPRIGYVGPGPSSLIRGTFRSSDIVLTGLHASFVDTRWHEYGDDDRERASHCMKLLHAEHLAERQFDTMSEGEKKRVLIARSLMASPELLLLDEPGSGLDLGARERLLASLSELTGDPNAPTVILVTHHVEEIPPGFTDILMLSAGKVIAAGPVGEVLTSETLSMVYDMDLQLTHDGGRWHAKRRAE